MTDIATRIIEFNKGRLPEPLQLKYEAMAESTFRFFRGTCHLFYEDLYQKEDFPDSPPVWICGDMHIENLGSFKGDNRQVYFDLNDFDEAILAPCLWEIARMLTSILLAFDELELPETEALNITGQFIDVYAKTLAKGKTINLDARTADGIVSEFLQQVEKRKQKELLKKRTFLSKKGKLLLSTEYPKHLQLDPDLKAELLSHMEQHLLQNATLLDDYQVKDVVFRLAGTGSLGVKRYVFLLQNKVKTSKYLFLDMKQALPSALKPYVSVKQPQWASEAERVMALKFRMQAVSPALQGCTLFKGDSFVLEEMQPSEDRIDFEQIKNSYKDINRVIVDMAELAASSQLRSTGRQGSAIADKMIALGKNHSWHKPLLKYACAYAEQVKKDFSEYLAFYKKGAFKQ